jgi:hypothetical protein
VPCSCLSRLALIGSLVAGCGGDTRIEILALNEHGTPLEELEIVALPYDSDRLLDSLEALAPNPRPDYSALEAELLAFRRPSYQEDDAAVYAWAAVRDSVNRLSDSLRRLDRRSAGYGAAYERFRRLYERFLQRTAARDAQVRELTGEVRDLAIRAGRAADSLRTWEREAWAMVDSAAELTQAATGRAAVWGATDADGRLALTLPPGDWWLQALLPHEENPFVERAWNVPLTTQGFPYRVPLGPNRAKTRWRH